MKMKSLLSIAVLLLMAAPAFAGTDAERPSYETLDKYLASPEKFPAQKVMNSVQTRLPQAEIANLLTQVEDFGRAAGPFSAIEAGKIEDELARQKAFWYEEYRQSLSKTTGSADLESFTETPGLDKSFDDLLLRAASDSSQEVTPEELKFIYEQYDGLSQTFQQLKLARFLAGSKNGIPRYTGSRPDAAEMAQLSGDVEANFVPGYQKRLQDGVSRLRKTLIASR